jgi:hypothetical protein
VSIELHGFPFLSPKHSFWALLSASCKAANEWISYNTLFGCTELGQEIGIQEFGPEFQRLEWHGNWARNSGRIP